VITRATSASASLMAANRGGHREGLRLGWLLWASAAILSRHRWVFKAAPA